MGWEVVRHHSAGDTQCSRHWGQMPKKFGLFIHDKWNPLPMFLMCCYWCLFNYSPMPASSNAYFTTKLNYVGPYLQACLTAKNLWRRKILTSAGNCSEHPALAKADRQARSGVPSLENLHTPSPGHGTDSTFKSLLPAAFQYPIISVITVHLWVCICVWVWMNICITKCLQMSASHNEQSCRNVILTIALSTRET